MNNPNSMRDLIYDQFAGQGYEVIDWTLYDSLFTTAGATQTLEFFQNSSSTGKARTNMDRGGSLPDPQAFLATGLECHVFNADGKPFFQEGAAAPTALPQNALFSKASVSFYITPKEMFQAHMRSFSEQIDMIQDNGTDHKATGAIGSTMFRRVYKFRQPLLILPQRAFSLKMTLTTPSEAGGYTAANTLIMWIMTGQLRRNSN